MRACVRVCLFLAGGLGVVDGASAQLLGCRGEENEAGSVGGFVYVGSASLSAESTRIESNTAGNAGAGEKFLFFIFIVLILVFKLNYIYNLQFEGRVLFFTRLHHLNRPDSDGSA